MIRPIVIIVLLFFSPSLFGQKSENKRIIVLGLDSMQFFSDAFYAQDLASMNDTEIEGLSLVYGNTILQNLNYYTYKNYTFRIADRKLVDSVRLQMDYLTLKDKYGEEYLGIVPRSKDQSSLINLIAKYNADYVLSINLYEILALSDSVIAGDDVEHAIHFDLLDANLRQVNAGRFTSYTSDYSIYYLDWFYKDFAIDQIFWIRAFENPGENDIDDYRKEIDIFYEGETSLENKSGAGIVVGAGMPYGGVGIEYSKFIGKYMDWNVGVGFDFSGLKLGGGFRYYILGIEGTGIRPFAGINIGLATGNKFTIGGETDEFGNQIDPADVSTYKIFGDQAVYIRTGFNYLVAEDVAIVPTFGYSFPFSRKNPELLIGPEKQFRENFVKFSAVGGIEVGLSIIYFW